jgi:dihydropteroate synthase
MNAKDTFFYKKTTLNCRGHLLDLARPKVMGILNLTPDSFYDGGQLPGAAALVEKATQLLQEGAAILDIGAVSSRPGAADVEEKEEERRLLPALQRLLQEFPQAIFSVDTYRASIAAKALDAGAHIINDISAGADPAMFPLLAQAQVPYILMHMQGTPASMQHNPVYNDVVKELLQFFDSRLAQLRALGVHDVVIDPGFGFGKTAVHNYTLLKHLQAFDVLRVPLLAGVSRKGMIQKIIGTGAADALNGTTVAHTIALLNGASILRVHDVKAAVEAVKIVDFYSKV